MSSSSAKPQKQRQTGMAKAHNNNNKTPKSLLDERELLTYSTATQSFDTRSVFLTLTLLEAFLSLFEEGIRFQEKKENPEITKQPTF